MNQEQFKQGWVQLEKHLKMHWDKFTQEDYALIDGNLERFNRVNEQRYGATHGDVRNAAVRRYAKWAGWYQGYEEAPSPS